MGESKRRQANVLKKQAVKGEEPTHAEINQIIALFNSGRHEKLEAQARLLVDRYPDSGSAWKALGASLQMQGKDAIYALQKASNLMPGDIEIHYNLGSILHDLGQLEEAVASYRRALEIKPGFAEAHNDMGNALKDLGQLDAAVACYRRALAIKPDYAVAHNNLGNALLDLGQPDGSVASCRRALELQPDFAEAHNNLGNALHDLDQLDAAVASFRRALKIKPDSADTHNNLGNALRDMGQLDDAVASFRRALEIKPDLALVHSNLGKALLDLGQLDDAVASCRQALEIKPDLAEAHTAMLFCLSHNEKLTAQALFAEHVRFGEQFEAPLRANWPQHTNSRNTERGLQIGFVSGDFCKHAVANFIEPVLAHLSGYPQLLLHAYSNNVTNDSTTQRLRGYFAHWHPIAGLSDAALTEKIRADGIDILIDLSGHTGKNRLLTFARKPAPVQASWMGYPGTTGLGAMDYYLADRFLLPPGQFDGQFTEKIVRLPASAPFLPNNDAPPVNALPALSNGYMTFGSFNRVSKLNPMVISLWSQLLRALPDSRILLGSMPQDGNVDALIELFARESIAQERLILHPRCGMDAYLRLHQQVDICLDTFPYNGGTTTCHALWMGIPTLTLTGDTLSGRQGAALLCQVGLEAFVAHDAPDFVQKGLAWACNLTALAGTRADLRGRFAQSPRGQPAMIASDLERALRIMWQRWCAGLSAESFEVSPQDMGNAIQEADK